MVGLWGWEGGRKWTGVRRAEGEVCLNGWIFMNIDEYRKGLHSWDLWVYGASDKPGFA